MRSIRRRLVVLVLALVGCQIAGMAATPAAVWQTTTTDAGTKATACTCAHGSSAECPMHGRQKPASHDQQAPPSSSSPDTHSRGARWCRGTQGDADVVLTALFVWVGQTVARQFLFVPQQRSASVLAAAEPFLTVARSPFLRPPRS